MTWQDYPRLIQPVIDRVIAEVPDDTGKWRELRMLLTKLLKNQMYVAPESQDWKALCYTLNNYLPFPPETDWQKRIMKIIRNDEE